MNTFMAAMGFLSLSSPQDGPPLQVPNCPLAPETIFTVATSFDLLLVGPHYPRPRIWPSYFRFGARGLVME